MGTVAALAPRRLGRTIMIFAPKGGVGKTTISAHILVSAASGSVRLNSSVHWDKWCPAGFRLLRIAAAG